MAVIPPLDLTRLPIERQEVWAKAEVDDGRLTQRTAHIDIVQGDVVVVSYDLLAALLALVGFTRIEHLPPEPTQGDTP